QMRCVSLAYGFVSPARNSLEPHTERPLASRQGRSKDFYLKGQPMSHPTRRAFLKSTLAAAASVTIAGTKSSGRVLGANDTIHIAVAGLNGRGGSHVGEWGRMDGVEITYLIDPDTRTYAKRLKQAAGRGGKEAQV